MLLRRLLAGLLPRLRSVRFKMTALVALVAVAALLSVVALWWIVERNLLFQARARVPATVRGFATELDDELRVVENLARQVASMESVAQAVRQRDDGTAAALVRRARKAHPHLDLLLFDVAGRLVATVGIERPTESAQALPAYVRTYKGFRGVVRSGCSATGDAGRAPPPAFVISRPLKDDQGLVVACLPLNGALMHKATAKLGIELVVLPPDGAPGRATPGFPRALVSRAGNRISLHEDGEKLWAMLRFTPGKLTGKRGVYAIVGAMDLSSVRDQSLDDLRLVFGVLGVLTLCAMLLGARLASRMSRGIRDVASAFGRLEKEDFSHVTPPRSGDELEALARGFNTMTDGLRERQKLRATLGKYLTETVMEHLLRGRLELGGETLTVTILFSDIRSFTAISESMEAQSLVRLLNEYFTAMVDILMQEDAVVDKYIGDAIMAVFGAPVSRADDALRACRAAVRMREALVTLDVDLEQRGLPELRHGIGIHTGEVVAGNIGSDARMEYTVIGDAVNLTSRLETATKEHGVGILISEDTYRLVVEEVEVRLVGELTVKGRARPVKAYELLGMRERPGT